MAKRYDIEKFMTDYLQKVKDKIVAKLTEISDDKGDALLIPAPDDEAWSTYGLPDRLFNFPVFGLLVENGAGEPEDAHGHKVAETVVIANVIGFQIDANENEEDVRKKLQRYRRALKEIAEENVERVAFAATVKITVQTPFLLETQKGVTYHLVGITMEVTIT